MLIFVMGKGEHACREMHAEQDNWVLSQSVVKGGRLVQGICVQSHHVIVEVSFIFIIQAALAGCAQEGPVT